MMKPFTPNELNRFMKTIVRTIKAEKMIRPKERVLCAVSGGPDSMALLFLLLRLADTFGCELGCAHLNHDLRGAESERDAEFVAGIAREWGLPFYMEKKDVRGYQAIYKISLEDAARQVRYAFLEKIAQKHDFQKIALGHHANDNAEMVLMNFLRGSGPLGLSGIPPRRGPYIIRPLLKSRREDIEKLLASQNIPFVQDSSNSDMAIHRNRIRHHLLPELIAAYNPNIDSTLNRLSEIMRAEEHWIEEMLAPVYEVSLADMGTHGIGVSLKQFDGMDLAVQRRVIRRALLSLKGDLKRISLVHVDTVRQFMSHPKTGASKKRCLDLPDGIRAHQEDGRIRFAFRKDFGFEEDLNPKNSSFAYPIVNTDLNCLSIFIKEINKTFRFGYLASKKIKRNDLRGGDVAFLDANRIVFPLLIRNLKAGDRFRPLGAAGTQKVKKYFIDHKIPRSDRWNVPVLVSAGNIIWLAGHQIDESVKITSQTVAVLKIEIHARPLK